jgi:hypothetical protein
MLVVPERHFNGALARSSPTLCASIAEPDARDRDTMNLEDALYLAIVLAFFLFYDWIVGKLDDRKLDEGR